MTLNRLLAIAALAGTTATMAFPVHADRGGPGHHQSRHGRHGEMRGLRALDLSEAQRDQIFRIRHEQAPAARERMKAARAAHEALRQAARDPNADGARIRSLADAVGKAHADAAVARVETQRRILAVLTPEQRQKINGVR